MLDLSGKICLVTGANRGIGRAIASRLTKNGAVVYAEARTQGSLDSLIENLDTQDLLKPIYFDVCDTGAIKACIMQIKREQSRLDVVVNNAGVMMDAPIGMISDAMIEKTIETNIVAPLQLIQFASKLMKRQRSGSIINMSSMMATYGNKNQMLYASSKGAIVSMTKAAAKELAPYNVRVNAIAPGSIDTDLFHQVDDSIANEIIGKVGLGRLGQPSEVADLCAFLASDSSSYITGQIIGIDGAAIV